MHSEWHSRMRRTWFGTVMLGVAVLIGIRGEAQGQDGGNVKRAAALDEATRLDEEAVRLYDAAKYDEAIPLAEKALAIREAVQGPDHPDVGSLLNILAELYRAKGDYDQAEPRYQRALAIAEKALGPHHAAVGVVLNNIGALYNARRDYVRAEPALQRALAIAEKVLGPDAPGVALPLNNLAWLYRVKEDYVRAESFLLRALTIVEKSSGLDHPDVAILLNNLAGLYDARGDYVRAEPLHRRAIGILEKALGPEHPFVARSLSELATLYQAQRDYAKARPLYERALTIQEKALGREHLDVATSLMSLARLHYENVEHERAEPLYERALAIREKVLGPDHYDVAISLNNLAELYYAKGDYARAEPLNIRALAIAEKVWGLEHPKVAIALDNLAKLYCAKGDYARAESLNRRALGIWEKAVGPDHPDVATSLNNLAALYHVSGDNAQAEPLFQRALRMREKMLGVDHPDVAQSLNNLAGLYVVKGEYAQAERFYARALAIWEKVLGPDHPEVAAPLNNLAMLFEMKGEYGRAEPLYKRAIRIGERALGPDHPHVAVSLSHLSRLYWARDDIGATLSGMERVMAIEDRNATRELTVGASEQRRAYMETLRENLDKVLSLHASHHDAAKRLAFRSILRRKALMIDAMSNSFVNLRERLSPDGQRKFDDWRMLTAQYSAMVQRGPGKKGIDSFRASLQTLNDAREKAENELSFISKNLQAQLNPVTIEQVEKAIPKGAALVDLFRYQPFNPKAKGTEKYWGSARFVAYVLHPSGRLDYADLGEAKPIEDAVKAMRFALSTEARDPKPAAHDLYHYVMAPIAKLLGQTKHVYLSPDGVLSLVPFGAMIGPDGHYVAENLAITYLTTGRDLVRWTNQVSRQSSAVFSAPSYESGDHSKRRAERTFGQLWAGVAEGRAVQAKLRDATLFDGARATESALKALHGPEVVHISTHGFFDKDLPALHELPRQPFDLRPQPPVENALLRSGLAFAGANHGGVGEDDGILTAMEASQLDLWGTKLVVLAACDTGRGEVENGDGVYGLRRAFAIAGAETVVMSLWSVDADATTELVTQYYDGLEKGGGRAEALRQAQLVMLANSKRSHPHYWASLIVSGNDNTMDGHPVPSMFGRISRGGTCGACEIGTHESSSSEVWLGIAITGAVLGLRRRGAAHVENGR